MKSILFAGISLLFIINSSTIVAQEINWMSIEDLEAAQENETRKVFVDVYTDWCGWCKRMDKTTFKDKGLVDYVNDNFYCVKLDGEDKNILKFRGFEFKFIDTGRRGYNQLAYDLLQGKMSYPSLVILNEKYEILQTFKGYRKAKELVPIVTYLGENIFKDKSWDDYVKESKGEK